MSLPLVTFDEYRELASNEIQYELFKGIVLMSPSPSLKHQLLSGNLQFELRMKKQNCTVVQAYGYRFATDTYLIPDISIMCDKDEFPLIVMEILSPGNAFNDRKYKLHAYREYGIKEYWMIDPENEIFTVHTFSKDTVNTYTTGQIAKSLILPWVEIKVDFTVD